MCCTVATVVLAAGSVLVTQGATSDRAPNDAIRSVIDCVVQREQHVEARQVDILFSALVSVDLSEAVFPTEWPNASFLRAKRRLEVSQYRIRLETEFFDATSTFDKDLFDSAVETWNGRVWMQSRMGDGTFTIDSHWPIDWQSDCLGLVTGAAIPSLVSPQMPLSEFLQSRAPDSADVLENGLRLTYTLGESRVTRYELTFDGLNRLSAAQITTGDVGLEGALNPIITVRYTVLDWIDEDSPLSLPRLAVRDAMMDRDELRGRLSAGANRIEFRVQEIGSLAQCADVKFDLWPESGQRVRDLRFGATYRIGSNSLDLDGQTVTVTSEIRTLLDGKDIEQIVEGWPLGIDLVWDTPSEPDEQALGAPQSSMDARLPKYYVIGTILVGVIVLTLWMARSWDRDARVRTGRTIAGLSVLAACSTLIAVLIRQSNANRYLNEDLTAYPLSGTKSVDFGTFDYRIPLVEQKTRFQLENVSDDTLQIAGIRYSCACTSAALSRNEVPPGEVINVDVTVEFQEPGRRLERAWLVLSGDRDRVVELTLEGRAVLTHSLRCTHRSLSLVPNETARIGLIATSDRSIDAPLSPSFESSVESVSWNFSGWRKVIDANPVIGAPTRWHAELDVAAGPDFRVDRESFLQIRLGTEDQARVHLNGWGGPRPSWNSHSQESITQSRPSGSH